MQTAVLNVLRPFLEWVADHLPAPKVEPDDDPHTHMDLEPPPYFMSALRASPRR